MRIGPDAAARFEAGERADRRRRSAPTARPWRPGRGARWSSDDGAALRVYLDADDTAVLAPGSTPGAAIAVTGGDVKTLASAQAKGRVRVVEELTALDIAIRERATELFVQAVHETDGSPRELIESMVPERFVAVHVRRRRGVRPDARAAGRRVAARAGRA